MPEPRRMFQFIGLTVCAVVGIPVMADVYFQRSTELTRNPAFAFGWKRQAVFTLMATVFSTDPSKVSWQGSMPPVRGSSIAM